MPRIKKWMPGLFLSIPFLLAYLFTTNQLFSFDALTNGIACESNEVVRWFHPNHLLYPFIGVAYYRLERLFGYTGFSIYSLARLNSFLMAGALIVLFRALQSWMDSKKAAAMVTVYGSCYAVWAYAVDGRAVGASFFFGALVVCMLSDIFKNESFSTGQALKLGVLSSLYTLMHGIALFHALAVWFGLGLGQKRTRSRSLYLLTVAGVLSISYALVYILVAKPFSNPSFFEWVLGYAGVNAGGPLKSTFWTDSLVRSIFGMWFGWCNAFYFPENRLHMGVAHALGGIATIIFGVAVSKLQKSPGVVKRFAATLILWGGLVALFLAFWSPGQEGFRLHIFLPIFFAVALLLSDLRWFMWSAFGFATILFVLNLMFPISYAATIKNNQGYQDLKEISSLTMPGDIFLCAKNNFISNIEVLRPYFFNELNGGTLDGRLFAFKEEDLKPLVSRLQEHSERGKAIYFGDDLYQPEVQDEIEEKYELEDGAIAQFLNMFKIENTHALASGKRIYRCALIHAAH